MNHHNSSCDGEQDRSSKELDFHLAVRQMKFEEVEQAARIFSDAGLVDSVSILQSYYETDPAGFVVAVNEDKNELIGSCAAPLTTHQTAFIGLYVVHPKYQRLGIGVQMFGRCLEKVGPDNCGIGAIPNKFAIYRDRAGFNLVEGRQMVIAEGRPHGLGNLKTVASLDRKHRLVRLSNVDYDQQLVQQVIDYDQTVHLDNRDRLLRSTFAKADTITVAMIVDDGSSSGRVVGYGCVRPDIGWCRKEKEFTCSRVL